MRNSLTFQEALQSDVLATGLDDIADRHELLRRAHHRSAGFGLDAAQTPDYHPLSRRALGERVDCSRALYRHALPVMESLYRQVAGTDSMVLLSDSSGVILHSVGDGSGNGFAARARDVALAPGVSWSEASKGTNAIGTALAEGRPAIIHGDEHFLHANRQLTCSCTPIAGPTGAWLGALDVSGDPRGFQPHTMALVRMSAQTIENQLFAAQFADALVVRFHARSELVGTLFEGMAAFSSDGTFLAANRSGWFQLGMSADTLAGAAFSEVFALPMPPTGTADTLLRELALPSGVRIYARLSHRPETVKPVSQTQTAVPPASALARLDTGDARMAAVLQRVARLRGRDIPLLILGPTGSGKEWLARAVHADSPRAAGPFVAVNCAAIPETLIEAELFGYEEGAFTGARRRGHAGKIAQAHGGTLFLDEIGDMPLAQQVRLVRVLQDRAVTALGGAHSTPVDIRIVCATHRDLRAQMADGTFREDLYYRVHGLAVTLPALVERSDFDELVSRILDAECGYGPQRVSASAMARLRRHAWPGNLRELSSVLRTAALMAEGEARIDIDHLPEELCGPEAHDVAARANAQAPGSGGMREWEAARIRDTLARHGGNISAAARELGVSRNTIYRRQRQRRTT